MKSTPSKTEESRSEDKRRSHAKLGRLQSNSGTNPANAKKDRPMGPIRRQILAPESIERKNDIKRKKEKTHQSMNATS